MKIDEIIIVLVVVLACCLAGCTKTVYVPTCPFGVSYMTRSDYEILSDPNKMSDMFVDWVIANNEFCEQENKNGSK